MAARGAESKEKITQKILETFSGSFIYEKEIRVPVMENGEQVQIKVVLTCAKVNVECGGDVVLPGDSVVVASTPVVSASGNLPTEPSAEEKKNVQDLLTKLGIS